MLKKKFDQSSKKNRFLYSGLTFVFSVLLFASLVLPLSFRPSTSLLMVGDVAFQDIRSPRKFNYISENLTDQAKKEAEKSVTPVYLPADPSISRKQLEKLKNILQYINAVRSDIFSTSEEKVRDLIAISELQISEENANVMIGLAAENWDSIQSESIYLLEQIMRSSIREDQVTIVQRNISPQISFDFDETETEIIKELVSQLIVANSLFSSDLTNQAVQEARDSVEPVLRQFASGEIIVSTGQVISQLQWEALQELGYAEPRNRLVDYISAGFLVIALMSFNILYIRRIRQTSGHSVEGLPILAIIFLIFLLIARFSLPNHVILPYMFPIAAFGMMISSLYNYELGLILTLSLSILTAYGHPNMSDLALFYFLTSGISILILGRGRRTTTFFLSGLGSTIIGSLVVISNRLINSFLDLSGAGTLIGATLINGFGSVSLTLILQYLLAQVLGKTTALQLMDLSRPDHPLLQDLLRNAPGTYQHCLQVANLAEQAAREINADALLTRVGALYHDIGKSKNPAFFIENQLPSSINTHEDLDPIIASATIIQHVEDGMDMARKYRIPPQIKAFISEHHGSMITRYQYEHALEKLNNQAADEDLDVNLFKYPGQSPQSKETALVMLADGSEARVRAESPESFDEVTKIIDETISNYENEGQLNFTDLTKNDLRIIKKSFSRTLQNTYHHRIKYPKNHHPSQGE